MIAGMDWVDEICLNLERGGSFLDQNLIKIEPNKEECVMKLIRKQNLTLLPLQLLVIKHTRKIICLEEIFVPCMQVRKLAISDLR